jgi:hypothetical protein
MSMINICYSFVAGKHTISCNDIRNKSCPFAPSYATVTHSQVKNEMLSHTCKNSQRTLQEDVNPTSALTSGGTNKQMSIARRLAVEHTLATSAEDAQEQRKERALQRLPWTRVFTYQMLFTEKTPKRKMRVRQPSALVPGAPAPIGMTRFIICWVWLINSRVYFSKFFVLFG